MRKTLLLAFVFLTSFTAFGQDFSNKGKDFWVGYGYHSSMLGANGGSQDMVLYFATDQVTNITIVVPATGYTQTITTGVGNNVVTSAVIPKTGVQDAKLLVGGLSNNGIHITSDKPMVAYAHIYNGNCSGATILYPTNTLGREYYSVNYKNWSNNSAANCWFYVMATDTGTTTIEITPQANIAGVVTTPSSGGWTAGTTYTVNLTQGQIYNVMGILTATPAMCNPVCSGVDLTGSRVKSINNGTGCKKISVFSGSGRISITCNNNQSSSDNYMVQAMPKNAWGKKYLTAPANGNQANNIYRVCVSNPAAVVKINGAVTALPLQNNFYYEIPATNQPQLIEADSAIMVAQYFTSQNACTNGNPGDPEVIYLSAVEQSINKVLWNATPNFAINSHFFNVVIPNAGTALSSFLLDGAPVGGWVTHPQEPNYSYLRMAVGAGPRVIQSDSGFNAIAYGFANAESYGYNAGTNIKDLYQQIGVQTTYGIETTPSVCTNSPFKFKVSLPYIPDSMRWVFNGAAGMLPNNNTVYINNTGNVAEDSFTVVNGRTLHWYSAPTQYTFTTVGVYPIDIITFSPNGECGTEQDIPFDLTVSDPPIADFAWTLGGCVADSVQFTETTPQFPKPTYRIWWDFGDPASGAANNSILRNPKHLFTTPGVTYTVKYASITTPGCLSDTIVHTVFIDSLPNATISGNTTVCINAPSPPVTFNGLWGTAPYFFYYTIDPGTGPGPVQTAIGSGVSGSVPAPTNVAGTFIYRLVGVANQGPPGTLCTRNISGQSITVNITPDATVTLRAGDNDNQTVCIDSAIVPIRYDIGGSGNGGTVTGLPPGVTGTYTAGVITITGNPTTTVGSPFTYTINPTGPCAFPIPPVTGTITVTENGVINLSPSSPGAANQAVCVNTPIADIIFQAGGSTTNVTVAGLPPGLGGVYNAGTKQFAITGSPNPVITVTTTYNYTLTTTGPCVNPTAGGIITVRPDATITLAAASGPASPTVCVNNAIIDIVYDLAGEATGAVPDASSVFPPGVTGSYNAATMKYTITGTPTLAGVYIYRINSQGPCLTPFVTGTITVTGDGIITLTSAIGTDSQTVCRNTSIIDIDYSTAGTTTGATIAWTPSAPTGITFTPLGGGNFRIAGTPTVVGTQTYKYTITTTGPCVNPTDTGSITVNALPIAAFNTTSPRCTNNLITFNNTSTPNAGPTTTWEWDFGDGSPINSSQNPTYIYSIPNSYTATLRVINSNGCISDPIASQTFVVNDTPRAGFIVPEVCINDVATPFIDTSNIPTGTIIRAQNQWNYGDPFATPGNPNTSVGQDGLHLYTVVGTYTVTQIVTSNTGCTDTIPLEITISAADPVSNFTVGNSCSSDSVALLNLSTVSFGNVTKLDIYWDNVGAPGVFETINTPVFNTVYKHKYPTLQTTQSYSIRMIAYSGNVCFTQRITPVTVYATPVVQFNAIPNTCYLVAPFLLTQGSEIGGVPGTGTYSGPGIINPNGTFNPQIAGVGTHPIKYTWTASNPGACIDTLTRFITVLDTAHATFSFVLPACEQVPVSFTDLSTAPATVTIANTVWDFGDATPVENHAPGSTFTHTFALPGTYNVRMHNVSTDGCLSTDTVAMITIDPNHGISLNPGSNDDQTVCINIAIAPIVYTLSGGATGATVTGLPAGLTATVAGTPPTLTISGTPNTTLGSPFTYTVLTTGNSCVIADTTGRITVQPDHIITFNSGDTAQSVCVNTPIDPIVYDLGGGANGVTIANLPPGVTYTVVGSALTISGTPTTTAGGPLFNFTIQTTGNSCLVANTIGEIRVNPYPVPDFTVDKPGYCIPNAIVKFTNASTMPDGSGMTYVWDLGDGSLPNPTSVDVTHWYVTEGPFNVKLTARSTAVLNNNVIGCMHDTTIALTTIHPQPKADFVFSKPSVCIGDNVLITDNTDGKDGIVNQWHWDMGDGSTRLTNPVTYTYADTITYTITMYSINTHGCNSDTISKPFTVYPYPHVNAGPDKFVLEGGSVELESTSFANDPQYTWTPNLYLTDARIQRPRVVNPKTDMTYLLTVTGRGGCAAGDNVFVKLLKFPVIPNTFTPNGDGINDKWRIDYLNTYPNNRVQIFTRAGNLIFESRGYNTPWDGTLKGKPMPFDTYYYIIEPGNGRDPITGYVTIIK